jgi:hypothetical protein
MNRRIRALLLTALVLPGLGQLYLGRKITGIVLIMLVNLLLLLALFMLMKGAAPAITTQVTSGTIKPDDILAGLNNIAGYGRALLIAFALLWGFAVIDILRNNDGNTEQN